MKSTSDMAPNERDSEREVNLSLERILTVLMDESVRSRVRHRALLALLERNGVIQLREYVEEYERQEDAHYETLFALLVTPRSEFLERNSAWLESERERFGFVPRATMGVEIAGPLKAPMHGAVPEAKSRKKASAKQPSGKKPTQTRARREARKKH